jgi:hypothetical protein
VLERAVGISAAQRPADVVLLGDLGLLGTWSVYLRSLVLWVICFESGSVLLGIEAKAVELATIAARTKSRSALFLAAIRRSLYDSSS